MLLELDSFPEYIGLIAGEKANDKYTARSNPMIWIGSNDYHTFNKLKNKVNHLIDSEINRHFILFIDDCVAGATDWVILSMPPQ